MDVSKIAFVCEGNAGRSQLATALAERERDRRGLDLEVVTGGVDPGDHVHEEVVAVLAEIDLDVSGRIPRRIRPEDVADAEYVVTMGCSVEEFAPPGWEGTAERWDLDHPSAGDVAAAREQRDEIGTRVERLFDDLAE
jgi:protein-tyrosine-phosphatase